MSFMQDCIGGNTGCKYAFMVCIAFQQIFVDTIKRRLGNLRAAGIIEEVAGLLSEGNCLRIFAILKVIAEFSVFSRHFVFGS